MNCVLYARVSSKEQEKEGFSIPAQRKLLREYAATHNMKVVKEFTDIETAKAAGRTLFGEMVQFFKDNKETRIILVEKTDRLYRNFSDYVLLEQLDLEIHLVKEGEVISKDSRSHAKFIHGIKLLMAKNYIDNLSEEVKKGMREKAEQGEFPGKAPLGYLNDKSQKLVVSDRKFAPLIQRLFELYASGGYSLSSLSKQIGKEGWRRRSGKAIGKSTVEAILKNPFYIGEFDWKGHRYPGKHESLVDRCLYDQVQKLLRTGAPPRSGRKQFLFSGLLKCSTCGCTIVGELKKGRYIYYHCTKARGPCDHPWIREEKLNLRMAAVLKAIEIDESTVSDITNALKDSHSDEKAFREKELSRLQSRQEALQQRLDKAYEDRLDGVIDERYWSDVSQKWRAEQDGIVAQIGRLTDASRDYVDEATEILELSKRAYSLYVKQETIEKRQLLKSLLSNCTSDGTTLYPTYKKPFNMIAEGVQMQFKLPRLDSN